MNNQTIYWLWIQRALGYGSAAIVNILEKYTFAEDFYRASAEERLAVAGRYLSVRPKMIDPDISDCAAIMERCRRLGIEIISYGDEAYPDLLTHIDSPPAVLFVKGDARLLSHDLCIGIVGTRRASERGRKTAFELGYELARHDVCVVSGGAVGIDAMAHRGVLKADGKTICVLGCGHQYPYLTEHDEMKKAILKNGAVISEFPPDMPPSKNTFPIRNRIISGLSKGIVVVEAGRRSGSLITANQALKQGRDVFAVSTGGDDPNNYGVTELLRDGAIPVMNAMNILAEYRGISPTPAKLKNDEWEERYEESIYGRDFGNFIRLTMSAKADADMKKEAAPKTKKTEETKPAPKREAPAKTKSAPKREAPAKTKSALKREAPAKPDPVQKPLSELPEDISENAEKLLNALAHGELHIDEIADKTGLPISVVHAAATELEMDDLIESLPGRRYRRISE